MNLLMWNKNHLKWLCNIASCLALGQTDRQTDASNDTQWFLYLSNVTHCIRREKLL